MLKRILLISSLFACCATTVALAKMPQMPPTFVETTTVQLGNRQEQLTATGTLTSIPGIIVKPEIAGRVTKVYFKSGDVVAANTPLIEINPDVIKAQLAEAQATLQLNKLEFERYSALYKTHDVSKSDYDKAQANYNSAQASVDNRQALLRQTAIVAPFNGKLGLSQVSVGDYINAGQSIVNLQTLDPLNVDFSVPEKYLGRIAAGQEVVLRFDAYPKDNFSGKVEAFESLINQNNRTLNVRASVPNKDNKLLPGAFVEVTLILDKKEQAIMIPQTAVVYAPDGNYVYKVADGKAVQTPVVLGERDKDNIVITSGLKVGDVIITAGQLKVANGAPVVVANAKK